MIMKQSFGLFCVLSATILMSACSKDKVIPQGKRVAILEQAAAVKSEVANGASQINLGEAVVNPYWRQVDANAQHRIPNVKMTPKWQRIWKADFGTGSSKHEFLISEPLLNGDHIYTLDADGFLRAFKLTDGEVDWAVELRVPERNVNDTAIKGVGLATDGNAIYATTGFGAVFAIRAKDGHPLWYYDTEVPLRIAPVLAAGKVLVQSVDNKFWALDVNSGEVLWQYDIAMEDTTMVGGAAAAYNADLDMVVTGFSNGELQAFKANIGTPLWSDMLISGKYAYSSTALHAVKAAPVIEGNKVYALGASNVMAAIDMRTGLRVWEKEISGSNTPLLSGNTLFVITDKADLVALDKSNGRILWVKSIDYGEDDKMPRIFGPVMINNQLVVAMSNGFVVCYDAKTGNEIQRIDTDEELNGAPIAANNRILLVSANAKLMVYE